MDVFAFVFWVLVIVGAGIGIVLLKARARTRNRARDLEEEICDFDGFDPADVYVSNYADGVAIDRERRLVALADFDGWCVLPIRSIVSCEVIEDGVQIARTNRGSQLAGVAVGGALLGGVGAVIGGLSGSSRSVNNVTTLALRFVTDDFDKPIHDIDLYGALSDKGVPRNDPSYTKALEIAELWHARVTAMMKVESSD